jgi:DNA-binding transcriptional LysR family regulator
MHWDKLQHFYLIATEGTISNAAKRLGVEQSSVTRSLKVLEQSLETELFIRTPRGVSLTNDGKILLQHVRKMIIEAEDALSSLNKYKNEIGGEITITTTYGFSTTSLFGHLVKFMRDHPETRIRLICDDEFLDLRTREADVSIRPYVSHGKDLVQDYLTSRKQHLYASPCYLEKNGIPKSLSDLKQHKFIIFNNPNIKLPYTQMLWFTELLSSSEGFKVDPYLIVNSVECLYQAATAGLGIIALSNDSCLLKNNELVPVLPELSSDELKFYFVYPKALQSSMSIRTLSEFLRDSYHTKTKCV